MWPSGALDQRDAEARSLVYTTPELDADLDVVGEPTVHLAASTSAVDTDFVVTLSDVHPDGYSEIVRQGALRGRHRNGDDTTELMEPGTIYDVAVRMTPVAHRFRKGHRLRIAVASSSFPNFLPNAGTGEPAYLATKAVVAENTVHHDDVHRSWVALPTRSA
jgi:putative CocE/NonD family hydrolase